MSGLALNLTDLLLLAAGLCLLAGAVGRRMVTLRALSLAGSLMLFVHGWVMANMAVGVLGALLALAHGWRLVQAMRNPPGRSGRGSRGGYRSRPLPIPTGDVERAPPTAKAEVVPMLRTAQVTPIRPVDAAPGLASRRASQPAQQI